MTAKKATATKQPNLVAILNTAALKARDNCLVLRHKDKNNHERYHVLYIESGPEGYDILVSYDDFRDTGSIGWEFIPIEEINDYYINNTLYFESSDTETMKKIADYAKSVGLEAIEVQDVTDVDDD